jgi:hypothetical protein
MIEDTLAKIEARLQSSDAVKDDKRRELQQLLATLKSEVAELSKTHALPMKPREKSRTRACCNSRCKG